jgi:hypothetical protein
MPSASLLHPSLVRIRDDKQVNEVDVRIAQLSERCAISAIESGAVASDVPRSVVVRRQVWTKETKGKIAVRKLVVWQTNKERTMVGFPAWVAHFTDYSPDRKTPLERLVRTAISAAEADRVADALIAENIKKGWEPVAENPLTEDSTPEATSPKPSSVPDGAREDSDGTVGKPKKSRKPKKTTED